MGRSFYSDEEATYNTPGLPTVPSLEHPTSTPNTDATSTINRFGNIITTSPGLQNFVSKIRTTTIEYTETFLEKYDYITSTAVSHSAMTADRIASFKNENEVFLPNACIVLTAALTGSIAARNHNFLLRATVPLLLAGTALNYTMPKTYDNVSEGFGKVGASIERRYFPDFKNVRESVANNTQQTTENVKKIENEAWNGLVNLVGSTRESLVETFNKKN